MVSLDRKTRGCERVWRTDNGPGMYGTCLQDEEEEKEEGDSEARR